MKALPAFGSIRWQTKTARLGLRAGIITREGADARRLQARAAKQEESAR